MNALELNPDEQIFCPYEKSHYIMRRRMNTHLTKCRVNHPDSKLVECDFNVNHKIPEPELQYHHENCEDRRNIEHVIFQEENVAGYNYPIQVVDVEDDQLWDASNAESYNPVKYCESNEVLRRMDVASAAVRKNFRMDERHRINQLSNNRPVPTSQAQSSSNNNIPSTSRRNLPDIPKSTITENTPQSVTEITERLKLGKNKAFLPRIKQ